MNSLEELSQQYGVPSIDLSKVTIDLHTLRAIPRTIAEQHLALPFRREGVSVSVAMADPSKASAFQDLAFARGMKFEIFVAPEDAIRAAFRKYPPPRPVG